MPLLFNARIRETAVKWEHGVIRMFSCISSQLSLDPAEGQLCEGKSGRRLSGMQATPSMGEFRGLTPTTEWLAHEVARQMGRTSILILRDVRAKSLLVPGLKGSLSQVTKYLEDANVEAQVGRKLTSARAE